MTTIDVGQSGLELSELLALAEAGEDVVITREGVPVARLEPIRSTGPGRRFLAAKRMLAGQIRIGDDFEFTDAELDEMLDQ
jgi:prevent-host-death family protein